MAIPSPVLPLRACLLSGGESRRMGRDKALLPHPAGGTWLEQSLRRLLALELPVSLLSRHPQHQALATWLEPSITALAEPPPWEGPLLALQRLMQHHPEQRLLVCPVDMPALSVVALQQLLAAAASEPALIHLAHDGQRLQPLLGIYPSDAAHRTSLTKTITGGERRLQTWLARRDCRPVALDPEALRNVNHPEELEHLSRAAAPG
jgi:molybdopterin-guanine dinucleotide biosynthesis protein A